MDDVLITFHQPLNKIFALVHSSHFPSPPFLSLISTLAPSSWFFNFALQISSRTCVWLSLDMIDCTCVWLSRCPRSFPPFKANIHQFAFFFFLHVQDPIIRPVFCTQMRLPLRLQHMLPQYMLPKHILPQHTLPKHMLHLMLPRKRIMPLQMLQKQGTYAHY